MLEKIDLWQNDTDPKNCLKNMNYDKMTLEQNIAWKNRAMTKWHWSKILFEKMNHDKMTQDQNNVWKSRAMTKWHKTKILLHLIWSSDKMTLA